MLQQLDSAIAFAVVMLILSLLITALVQIVNASFDLRGLNLVWALTRLFHQADPALQQTVGKRKFGELFSPTLGRRLAQAVSRYKPLASGIVGRAKAIRSDELLLVLRQMVLNPPGNLPAEAHQALVMLVNERVPGGAMEVEAAEKLAKNLTDQFDPLLNDQLKTKLDDVVRNTVGTVSKMEYKINQWFDSVMDRSSEIFSGHNKVYTFVLASILAFGWHIDSGQILHQISTDSNVRDNLNRAADSVMAQGEKLLQNGHVKTAFDRLHDKSQQTAATLQDTSVMSCNDNGEAWLTSNAEKLGPYEGRVRTAIGKACKSGENNGHPDFGTAIAPVLAEVDQVTIAWAKAPATLDQCIEGVRWIDDHKDLFAAVDSDVAAAEAEAFQTQCKSAALDSFGNAGQNIVSLRKTLDDSKLQVSTSSLHYDGKDIFLRPFSLTGYGHWQHLMGTLSTVLLLSLGAPFWFNTLCQLSNLKPAAARKIENQDNEDQDKE